MKQFRLSLALLLLILALSGCSSSKWLANHRAEIQRLAGPEVPPQEKFDGLAASIVGVLDEALRFGSVKKNVQHVQKFSRQNEADIEKIIADIDTWQQGMTTGDKIKFGAHALTQPYTRELVQLVPKYKRKVDRKINQLILLNKVLGVFKVGNLIK
jgi:hypothetical protein